MHELPTPGKAAARLEVLGGDVGGILERLGQVLGDHGLGDVGEVPGDASGEGNVGLLGMEGDFLQTSPEKSMRSGHL